MKTIQLTQGYVALVDDSDYAAVSQFKWYADKRDGRGRGVYAKRNIIKPNGKRATQYLHRFLMPDCSRIDHRDGDGLNNTRSNLRPATNKQNCQGFRQKRLGTTTHFRGIRWHKKARKWQARITIDERERHLGYFISEEEAAKAYDAAARKYFKDFASLNFPIK